ncbi:MAG: ubiG 2 [Gammaproteobacteria bacterium]|nr:ubiG 2 [Gammaproteobacteria bacterium]
MSHHNIDLQEIETFDAQASHWWDLRGPFQTLHAINPLRLAFITAATPLSGKLVIDVGCGGGILSEGMAKQGAEVTGVDMAERSLQAAREHAERQKIGIVYEQTTIEDKAAASPQKFDIVTCMEMLEHVPDPVSIIRACAALVKPDGHLFFSTINRNAKAYLFAILGAEYCLKLLPKGTHAYEKFIKPSELASWLRPVNLTIKAMAGIGYNPLTKQYNLTQGVDVNYLVHCRFL